MLTVVKRWTSVRLGRIGRTFARTRWILLSLVLATVGVAGLWVSVPQQLNLILGLLSLVLFGFEYVAHRRELRRIEFLPRHSDAFDDVREAVAGDERWSFLALRNGYAVIDRYLTKALLAGRLTANTSFLTYSPPPELRPVGNKYLDGLQSGPARLFRGPMVGIAGDTARANLDDAPGLIIFQRGDYFDHLMTDGLASVDVLSSGERLQNLGRRLFIDRRGMLRPFDESWLFNGVGTSTLAFAADGKLMTLRQSGSNINNPGMYAPAGSGALEPRDAGGLRVLRLEEFVKTGALRELQEECGVASTEVEIALPLGLARWLNQAGRPEFHSVAFLCVDSHALARRRPSMAERAYVRDLRFDRLSSDETLWHSKDPANLLPPEVSHSMSAVLETALILLMDAASDVHGGVFAEMVRRGIIETAPANPKR